MPRCPHCSAPTGEDSRFCPSCGQPQADAVSSPTRTSFDRPEPEPSASDPSGERARFVPGATIGRRYRIVGRLGRGGMGEVYRADDLKLGQPVALKFLPGALEHDAGLLQHLLNEVATARRITHPSVCRVHDVDEVDGHHFLSMEYVDGEDLATLLRRIGRPPQDKAVQLARQLCAGLAAAHDQGILHRDLKPANVMIDGRGSARITDFGLAGFAGSFAGAQVRSGTPAYMAPEQLEGREVTTRSDIYGLGLVLYELFTGRRAFPPATDDARADPRARSVPPDPARAVPDLDPAIARVLRRCLDPDPDSRPASPLEISAALPGGDPLAAALAAGETPSPEMVAAVGGRGALRTLTAAGLLIFTLLGLVTIAWTHDRGHLTGRIDLPRPATALAFDARRILADLGYPDDAVDRAHGFEYDLTLLASIATDEPGATDWTSIGELEPSPIAFWYRQSPEYMIPLDFNNLAVTSDDPAPLVPGMIGMRLDPAGRLLRLQAIPGGADEATAPTGEPDWTALFEHAGLDPAAFREVPPERVPPVYCDRVAAWIERRADGRAPPVRIEAGSHRGRPTYFERIMPWSRPREVRKDATTRTIEVITFVILLFVLAGAFWLARVNHRLGRGDRHGANRVALAFMACNVAITLFGAHHVPTFGESRLFFQGLAWGLMTAGMVWIVYMALEPFARKLWPRLLISWSRLLAGNWRDPRVGRDVLVGSTLGVGTLLVNRLRYVLPTWLELPPSAPRYGPVGGYNDGALFGLGGVPQAISTYFHIPQLVLASAIGTVFMLLLLRVLLRRRWAAVVVTTLIFAATDSVALRNPAIDIPISVVSAAIVLLVLTRGGLLALTVFLAIGFTDQLVVLSDLSAWYAGRFAVPLLVLAAMSVWAFRIARHQQVAA